MIGTDPAHTVVSDQTVVRVCFDAEVELVLVNRAGNW